jgi:predicted acetyltransferase
MGRHQNHPFMTPRVAVIPAVSSQEPILANLLQLYAHDFSEFHEVELADDGRFHYQHLPLYWREPNRHPFLVRVDERLAGLVLVKQGSEISSNQSTWDMAEFFVLRAYRRRGMGTEIAHAIWRRFPGPWEVRVIESNRPAHLFWERAISSFTGCAIPSAQFERDGARWSVFAFQSKG